jgi:Flp pilus assembly pilin Flp
VIGLIFSEIGQGKAEYAFLLVLVALVLLVILAIFGAGVGDTYSNAVNTI